MVGERAGEAMSEMADLEVIATRTEPCRHPEQTAEHHVKVKLRDGTVHDAAAVITAIEDARGALRDDPAARRARV